MVSNSNNDNLTYFQKVNYYFSKLENAEATFERGDNKTCECTGSFNHNLNAAGRFPIFGGSVRVVYGTCQIIAGLFFSVIFGIGALITSRISKDMYEGNYEGMVRSFKHIGHGIVNIARGVVEIIPLAPQIIFGFSSDCKNGRLSCGFTNDIDDIWGPRSYRYFYSSTYQEGISPLPPPSGWR